VKLTTGINFINVLRTAFTPKCIKMTVKLSIFFTLLGAMSAKDLSKTLMKLTPGVNFIDILLAALAQRDPESAKKSDNLTVFLALLGYRRIKAAGRRLMKLTPDVFGIKMPLIAEYDVMSHYCITLK